MAKYLIVNADDFGISPRVSEGIIEAHQRGIVTSTSVMAHMPAAGDAIRRAQQEAPRLGLGLHLTLSFGPPAAPAEEVSSLVTPEGTFCSNFQELKALAPRFTAADLKTEYTAQMERFIALAGHPPDHLDSHHGASYWIAAAFDVMLALAAQYGLPIRSPGTHADLGTVPRILAEYDSVRWPQHITPALVFFGAGATPENLRAILSDLPDGVSEFFCHPGYADDLDEAYAAPRENELKIVTDPVARDLLDRDGVQLINFAEFARLAD